MPYRKTPLINEHYYHIYNRGVEKRKIFLDKADYLTFISIIRWYLREELDKSLFSRMPKISFKDRVVLLCYAFMPNHYHFLIKQVTNNSISEFIRIISITYALYFNQRYERVGSLFQGRFKAKLIDKEEYLLQVSKYIHRNPLGYIKKTTSLSSYKFSSYSDYLDVGSNKLSEPLTILNYFNRTNPRKLYKEFVEESEIDKERLHSLIFEE